MKTQMGRPSIFAGKQPQPLIRATVTKEGRQRFELARAALKKLAKWPGAVSDADTVEFLLRGPEATKAYLTRKP